MRSIRRELTIRVLSRVLPLVLVGSVAVYLTVRTLVYDEFDSALKQQVMLLAAAAERIEGVGIDFDYRPELQNAGPIETGLDFCFDARLSDGSLLKQSPRLSGRALEMPPARTGEFRFAAVHLPDGELARGCELVFEPRVVPATEHSGPVTRTGAPPGPVRVVLAASTLDVDRPMVKLAIAEAVVGVLLLSAIGMALFQSVRHGLAPLEGLSQHVRRIDPGSPAGRIPAEGSPAELEPIIGRLNDLIDRVEDALARERRFTSNAAHELRTPISEIRTMAEVACELEGPESRRSLGEIVKVSGEMQETISTLLLIARCKSGTLRASHEAVDITALVTECGERRLGGGSVQPEVSLEIEQGIQIESDAAMIWSIVNNLLDNAVDYTPGEGRIRLFARAKERGVEFGVMNTCCGITKDDIPRMFEAFWRKRSTSVHGSHSGLGLALVKALTDSLGGDVWAHLTGPDELCVCVALSKTGATENPSQLGEISRL